MNKLLIIGLIGFTSSAFAAGVSGGNVGHGQAVGNVPVIHVCPAWGCGGPPVIDPQPCKGVLGPNNCGGPVPKPGPWKPGPCKEIAGTVCSNPGPVNN